MQKEYIQTQDYCLSVRDGTHDTPKPVAIGKPLVTSKAINNNNIDFSVTYNISEKDFNKINKRSLVEKWDLLMTMIGTVGRLHIVKNCPDYAIKNIALFKIKDEQKAKWLYYYLSLKEVQTYFQSIANGTSQHFIPLNVLRKLKIENYNVHSPRIINILSTYDDLIEKNNRKIAILQEMAEELYKEWFVRLRFPGYKTAKFKDGIPEGWNIKRLEEFGTIETGKTPSTEVSEYYGTDIPFVKTPDMHENMWTIETEEMLSTAGSNSQAKKLLPANSIMVSCIGTGGVVSINAVPSHTNQQINSIILNDLNELEWLFFTCVSLKPTIVSYGSTGATMTNLSKGKFEKLKILYPGKLLARKYHDKTKEIFFNIRNLMYLNKNLKTQRDLLLPRLMSGKLEVKV